MFEVRSEAIHDAAEPGASKTPESSPVPLSLTLGAFLLGCAL